jgi:hypothetical protein
MIGHQWAGVRSAIWFGSTWVLLRLRAASYSRCASVAHQSDEPNLPSVGSGIRGFRGDDQASLRQALRRTRRPAADSPSSRLLRPDVTDVPLRASGCTEHHSGMYGVRRGGTGSRQNLSNPPHHPPRPRCHPDVQRRGGLSRRTRGDPSLLPLLMPARRSASPRRRWRPGVSPLRC